MKKPITETPQAVWQARANRLDNPLLTPLGKERMVSKAQRFLAKLPAAVPPEEAEEVPA